jgi:hypothetical protein
VRHCFVNLMKEGQNLREFMLDCAGVKRTIKSSRRYDKYLYSISSTMCEPETLESFEVVS